MERLGSSYILEERIGTGAQGDVYRGHADGSTEPLAFKLLRSELTKERGVIDAFLKERDTLQLVDSPHVVRLRDMVVEGDRLALVMDYVGGGDLSGVLRERGTLAPGAVAEYGAAVAAGLDAVHAAGLVHRDVKPANVLMDDSTNPPTPRVADFGVARICDSVSATHSTGVVGTPLYMAPEVADGVVATPAADIYSLGVVLYELLCGVTPFVGSPLALIKAHASMLPGRPEGVPDQLWQLVAAMLEKNSAVRPTAAQVAEHLARLSHELSAVPAAARLSSPPAGTLVPQVSQTQYVPSAAAAGSASAAPASHPRSSKKKVVGIAAVVVVALVGVAAAAPFLFSGGGANEADETPTPVSSESPTSSTETSSPSPSPKATPSPSTSATPTVPASMPDLKGLTVEAAKAKLPGQVKVNVVKVGAPNKEAPGTVLSSDPAAGEQFGDEVTLQVASAMKTIYLPDLNSIGYSDISGGPIDLSGKSYAHGMYATVYSGHGAKPENAEWNLGRYFDTLSGTIGLTDHSVDANATFTVDFYLDQVLVRTETVKFGEYTDVSLDVKNALRLKIVVTRTDSNSDRATVGFGDFMLQGEPGKVPDLEDLNK